MKTIGKLFFVINILFALALLLSYTVRFISPETNIIPTLAGLAYPFLLVVNIFFIIWWAVTSSKRVFISVIVIALGFSLINKTYQISGKTQANKNEKPIHLISYNVQLFGLYNWHENSKIRDSIINYLEKEAPDIICFQEYYKNKAGQFPIKSKILEKLGYLNVNESYSKSLKNTQFFGNATYIKFPIINKGTIHFEQTNNLGQFTDFKYHDDTIRLYNLHLQSIYFNKENYTEIDKFIESDFTKEKIGRLRSLTGKIVRACKKRALQAEIIHQHIIDSPYPVIVCGDFNAPISSYTYSTISDNLNDAFQCSGKGFDFSFQRSLLHMRIDHILHDKTLKSYNFETKILNFSDHFPISCYLSVK